MNLPSDPIAILGGASLFAFILVLFYFNRKLSWKLNGMSDEYQDILIQRATLEERLGHFSQLEENCEVYRHQLMELSAENSELNATLHHERQQAHAKIQTLQEMQANLTDTFRHLSNQALLANNEAFLNLAKTSLDRFYEASKNDLEKRQKSLIDLVEPVQKALNQVDQKIGLLEKERVDAYSDLRRHLTDLLSTQKELRSETANLVKALRTPSARGQWGEIQLKRVVEMAGMLSHCDFLEQVSTEDGRLRPDMVVHLPGEKKIIVDAKAPLAAYLEALEAPDEQQRAAHLENHARQVRAHIRALSQRAYWEQFQPTPEFVVMFLPGESFFSAALDKDPSLIEVGVKEKVILATPTTLIALLRAVAFGWRQENIAENARAISDLGRELYKRLTDMNGHVSRLGRHIGQVVDSYNQTVGTLERRVFVSARKLQELDSSLERDVLEVNPLDSIPRTVQAIEVLHEECPAE